MRRLTPFFTFLALVATMFFLWQYRFEAVSGAQRITMGDLRVSSILGPGVVWTGLGKDTNLHLKIGDQASNPIALIHFLNLAPVHWLHVRYQISANNLEAGHEIWNDGRGIMEWHTSGKESDLENDQFFSARANENSGVVECILRPDEAPAYPVLRIENSGTKGELTIKKLEVLPLQERVLWKVGRWFLMLGWIGWVALWIRPPSGVSLRAVLAGIVWLLMGIHFVVPGPWKIIRPFGQAFHLQLDSIDEVPKQQIAPPVHSTLGAAPKSTGLVSVGKVEGRVGITLKIKMLFASIRPILHSLLLMLPTLIIACLVGQRPAIRLMAILALSIEAAQAAYGYGFDRMDVFDLFADSVGILIGVIIYHWLQRINHPVFIRLLQSQPQ